MRPTGPWPSLRLEFCARDGAITRDLASRVSVELQSRNTCSRSSSRQTTSHSLFSNRIVAHMSTRNPSLLRPSLSVHRRRRP
jgi:hypothetical protein